MQIEKQELSDHWAACIRGSPSASSHWISRLSLETSFAPPATCQTLFTAGRGYADEKRLSAQIPQLAAHTGQEFIYICAPNICPEGGLSIIQLILDFQTPCQMQL